MENINVNEKTTEVEAKVEEPKAETKERMFSQSEVDKIVEKRLAKEKQRAEVERAEAEKLARMSANEKVEYEYKKKNEELEARIKEYNIKELKQTSIGIFNEKGYSIETSKELCELLNFSDADSCKASIDALDKALKSAVEREVNNRLKSSSNVAPRIAESNKGAITWNDVLANPKLLADYKKQQKK